MYVFYILLLQRSLRWFPSIYNRRYSAVSAWQINCFVSATLIFALNLDATFGICDCDHSLRCGRPLILWPSKNRCYYAYDQGPCREGKWLVFGADLHPVCKRNPCLDQENQDPSHDNRYWFSYKNKCYKTYSRGYCDEGKILFNEKTNFRPTCVTTPDCATGPTGRGTIQSLACLPGQRLDFYGKCKRQFKPLKPLKNQTDLAIRVTQRPTNIYCLFCKQFWFMYLTCNYF